MPCVRFGRQEAALLWAVDPTFSCSAFYICATGKRLEVLCINPSSPSSLSTLEVGEPLLVPPP